MTDRRSDDRINIGYVVRTKGVLGEVKVEPLTHSLTRFDEITDLILERRGSPDLQLRIESWRFDQPGILIKFEGFDDPESARDSLVKGYLAIRRDELAPLPENEHYVFDLIGCSIEDESGRRLGEIADVLEMPSADVYVVRHEDREVMIPAVREFVRDISISDKRVIVSGVEAFLS